MGRDGAEWGNKLSKATQCKVARFLLSYRARGGQRTKQDAAHGARRQRNV